MTMPEIRPGSKMDGHFRITYAVVFAAPGIGSSTGTTSNHKLGISMHRGVDEPQFKVALKGKVRHRDEPSCEPRPARVRVRPIFGCCPTGSVIRVQRGSRVTVSSIRRAPGDLQRNKRSPTREPRECALSPCTSRPSERGDGDRSTHAETTHYTTSWSQEETRDPSKFAPIRRVHSLTITGEVP